MTDPSDPSRMVAALSEIFFGGHDLSAGFLRDLATQQGPALYLKIVRGEYFRTSGLAALLCGFDSPADEATRQLVRDELMTSAYAALGRAVPAAQRRSRGWNGFLRRLLAEEDLQSYLRSQGAGRMLQQIEPALADPAPPAWLVSLHLLFLGDLHRLEALPAGDAPTAIARLLADAAFRDTVLPALRAGGEMPQAPLWGQRPKWPFRARARELLPGRASPPREDWAALLWRLLATPGALPQRLLAGEPGLLAQLGPEAGEAEGLREALAALRQALGTPPAPRAATPPPRRAAPPRGAALAALLPLLGGPPPGDAPEAALAGWIASGGFRRAVLTPLQQGAAPAAPADAAAALAGAAAFPEAEGEPGSPAWLLAVLTGARFLGLLVGLPGAEEAEPRHALAALHGLKALRGLAPPAAGGLPLRLALAGGPLLVIESWLDSTAELTLLPGSAAPRLLPPGRPGRLALPLPGAEEGYSGVLRLRLPERPEAGRPALDMAFPLLFDAAQLAPLLAGLPPEARDALDEAQHDPAAGLARLRRLAGDGPCGAELLAHLADLQASLGDSAAAGATLRQLRPEDAAAPLARRIAARLALGEGRGEDALALYRALPAPAPDSLDATLAAAAASAARPADAADAVCRFLAAPRGPVPVLAPPAAARLAEALAALYLPPARLAGILESLLGQGLELAPLLDRALREGWAHRLQPALLRLPPPLLATGLPPAALAGLVRLALRQEQPGLALALAEAALQQPDPPAGTRVLAGEAALAAGQGEAAVAHWRQALALRPDAALRARLLALEAALCEADPLRPPLALRALRAEQGEAVRRGFFAAPTDAAHRFALAVQLREEGAPQAAREILDTLDGAGPEAAALQAEQLRCAVLEGDAGRIAALAAQPFAAEGDAALLRAAATALQAEGRHDAAAALLAPLADRPEPALRQAWLRALLLGGRAAEAAELAGLWLRDTPEDAALHLLAAGAALRRHRPEEAAYHLHLATPGSEAAPALQRPWRLLRAAQASRQDGLGQALALLDPLFAEAGLRPVRPAAPGTGPVLSGLRASGTAPQPDPAAPLVSVVLAAPPDAAALALTAEALLAQSHTALELILVVPEADAALAGLALALEGRDGRVRAALRTLSDGAGARLEGLARARGGWLMLLEAPLWLHPDALARMLATLGEHPWLAGLAAGALPLGETGQLGTEPAAWGEMPDPGPLLLRRAAAVAALGLHGLAGPAGHAARLQRLRAALGREALARLPWPAAFAPQEGAVRAAPPPHQARPPELAR
ncbi:glycosyltransferase [Pseudoroseomonas cervicalis]|uniref:glycosyltransferase n=1 Tax=Teichococcus cervicalis TaxID=204525 RepID=UPI0022F18A4D|nr:hypothetical protein [Pseudoroseomonas cervicalis]WBV44539.1 hypothetical protein PFY06_08285 [Pseudoroseomonas cervicalis]